MRSAVSRSKGLPRCRKRSSQWNIMSSCLSLCRVWTMPRWISKIQILSRSSPLNPRTPSRLRWRTESKSWRVPS